MAIGVSYRLRAGGRVRDRVLLRGVYEELASVRPIWVTAETFVAEDEESMIFLINTANEKRLAELRALSRYWEGLDGRCAVPSRTYALRRATVDKLPVFKIAFWNPYRKTWALPPHLPLTASPLIDVVPFGQ